jgi:hypothetical protein
MLLETTDSYNNPVIICLLTVNYFQARRSRDNTPGSVVYFNNGATLTINASHDDILDACGPALFKPRSKDTNDTEDTTRELSPGREPKS